MILCDHVHGVPRLEVKDFLQQRLDQLWVDLEQQLDVGLVQPLELLELADQVEVDPLGLAALLALGLEVSPEEVEVGILEKDMIISRENRAT